MIWLALFLPFLCSAEWYPEVLYPHWGQTFRVEEVLFEEKTEQQHLLIFKNALFGRVLALDGVIQSTERDEFVYHEMMAHVPLCSHKNPENILIIGGGDGGLLREVLKHSSVKKVALVEIDKAVIDFSKKYLQYISKGAFEDPRVQIVIQDGALFVRETAERYDVILCDSTDPEGPGKVLFTSEFYQDCHRVLNKEGILVNQNGVPFLQPQEFVETYANRKAHFPFTTFYLAVVPTYVGGAMALGFASDTFYEPVPRQEIEGDFQYYSPAVHQAAFALPPFMNTLLHR